MRTAKAMRDGRSATLRGVRLSLERLEMRLYLDASLDPVATPAILAVEPAGGPTENQSLAWSGYENDAPTADGGAASQYVISGVPKYLWYRGCGPTAAGMVVGYWDMHGYSSLILGSSSTQTASVNSAIASRGHYADYSKPLDNTQTGIFYDKSTLGGAHANNCIADWMHTSWSADNQYWGWSTFSRVGMAIDSYCEWKGYTNFTTTNKTWSELTWSDFKAEIDAGRPMVFLVDTTGSGSTNHFVPVIGYDETTHRYACYNTWDTKIHWYDYAQLAQGQQWGIYGAILVNPNRTPPTMVISNFSLREGNGGLKQADFTVSLVSAATHRITVDYATENGTATVGSDYAETAGTLTFEPGQVRKTISVPVQGDTTYENDENFSVDLSNASGATIERGTGVCTILNNDRLPTVAVNSVAKYEGNTGTTTFTFDVALSASSILPASVSYTTLDGKATAGSDYTAVGLTEVTFAPGETLKQVQVVVQGDTTYEGNETFLVILSNAEGTTLARGQRIGKGTILNDDNRVVASPGSGTSGERSKASGAAASVSDAALINALTTTEKPTARAGQRQLGAAVDEVLRLMLVG